ncbi:type VII toxin-antitoxin system MntA family adenylyltransferase antitoxin [Baekduia sp. Peel2402]|uniref:type VII toxin-antitoxin system MntA family adenylyltransferase antitoxin n=1 Tax=Baekduia sp. Peel2402 TaxID=3458296 RepID=UPI00403ECEB3
MESLRQLALTLDVPERTLRRAAVEGLIRGERVSERRYRTTLREEDYLRRHWPVLRELRATLRTEPSVRLAVLFGSVARGDDHPGSDIDVAVEMGNATPGQVAEVSARLSERLDRDVQLVRFADARGAPALMTDVLTHGRVLVDRDRRWATLLAETAEWRNAPAADPLADLPELT